MSVFELGSTLSFPSVELAEADGLLAVGGDLSVERLLLAYQNGIFPWYSEGTPILWWAPPKRAVLTPSQVSISRSLRKVIRSEKFEVRFDSAFPEVVSSCANVSRKGERGTWILPEMQEAYCRLHEAGFAHSVESWVDGKLVGGLYGLSLGGGFFGESMFSLVSDASKVAFATLAKKLSEWNFDFIDCQIQNPHLESLGAYLISREEFIYWLSRTLLKQTCIGNWSFL